MAWGPHLSLRFCDGDEMYLFSGVLIVVIGV